MAERDFQIDTIRELRWLKKKPVIPPAYEITAIEVRTPIVNDQIARLVGNLTYNQPQISIVPSKPGPEGVKKASFLEKATGALRLRLEQEAGKSLNFQWFDSACETGEGIFKVILRMDRWDQAPARGEKDSDRAYLDKHDNFRKSARLPLQMKVIDRRTFYPWRDDDGLARVYEITERAIDDVKSDFASDWTSDHESFSSPIPEDSEGGERKVKLIEYWDREWYAYVLYAGGGVPITDYNQRDNAGLLLRAGRHGYQRVPYFCGYGEETSSNDPNFEGMSSAFPIIYLAPFLDSLMTMWANVGYLTGFPTITKESPPEAVTAQFDEDSDQQKETEEFEPGKILEGAPGTKYNVLQVAGSTTALTTMVGQVSQMIQSAQLPSIMQGIPPGSRTAGYAIQELAAAAKAKYQNTIRSAERCWAEALNFCLWLIENKVKQSVYLLTDMEKDGRKYQDYLELKPEHINGYYAVGVKIQPRNPVDRIQEGAHAANMVAAGLMPKRAAIEDGLGQEQPDEWIDEMAVEEFLMDPQVRQLIITKAVQEAGLQGLLNDLAAVQQLQQQMLATQQQMLSGEGGQPGQPTDPNSPQTNGLGGGMTGGGQTVTAPTAPGMQIPGMPGQNQAQMADIAGAGSGQDQPRIYKRKGGRPAGSPNTQPARPGIEGFRGRS